MTSISKIQEKRKNLIDLSVQARAYKEKKINEAQSEEEIFYWMGICINRILLNYFYNIDGATEFKTFHDWKKEGATIIKGSKAFLIWGQPRKATKKHEATATQEPSEEEYKLWPLCFLFSDKQIFKTSIEAENEHQEAEEELVTVAFELD